MRIQTNHIPTIPSAPKAVCPRARQVEAKPEKFSLDLGVKDRLLLWSAGAMPLGGVVENMGNEWRAAQWEPRKGDDRTGYFSSLYETASLKRKISTAGWFSNLAGTASLAGGLVAGSRMGVCTGLALLGASGLAAAYSHLPRLPQ